jgi:hypothetical protein
MDAQKLYRREAMKMIEAAAGNLYSTNSFLNKNQSVNAIRYQESGVLHQQETFQLQTDTVNLTYSIESTTTYDKSLSLAGSVGDGFDLLRGLVLNIFKEQGIEYTLPAGDKEIDLNTITSEEAQELVADDGYFGVDKTSDRIFNLAIGIAGGDPTRLDAIKEGVENGFQEAFNAFGGWLPDISYETIDAVMAKLDNWAGIDADSTTLS